MYIHRIIKDVVGEARTALGQTTPLNTEQFHPPICKNNVTTVIDESRAFLPHLGFVVELVNLKDGDSCLISLTYNESTG